MRESLRISVPTPCGEDWAKMLPAGHGRHCDQCCKTVVDFTGMSDGEMLQFFKDRAAGAAGAGGRVRGAANVHPEVCGRFASDQLQRELAPAPVQRNGFNGWYLVLASALMVAGREEGRSPLKPKMEQRRGAPGDGQGAAMGVRCVQQDTIKPDAFKQPTMGAVAVRKMGKVFYGADTAKIAPPDTASRVRLVVDTVVTTVVTAIKDTAAAVFPGVFATDDVLNIYPNPVARGGTIRLAWRASGKYMAALFDLHGQMKQEREIVVGGKGQLDEWAVPDGLEPGVYFLRVSRPGKRVVTKEVVIQ